MYLPPLLIMTFSFLAVVYSSLRRLGISPWEVAGRSLRKRQNWLQALCSPRPQLVTH